MRKETWKWLIAFSVFVSVVLYQFVPRPPDTIHFEASLPEIVVQATDHYNKVTGGQVSFTDLSISSEYGLSESDLIDNERWLARMPNYADIQFRVNPRSDVRWDLSELVIEASSSGGLKYSTVVPLELQILADDSLGSQSYKLDFGSLYTDGDKIFGQARRDMIYAAISNVVNLALIACLVLVALVVLIIGYHIGRPLANRIVPFKNSTQT